MSRSSNPSRGARGVAALRERVRRLGAVVEAGALTHQTLDLHVIAERIVAMAAERIGAERGSLFLRDRDGELVAVLQPLNRRRNGFGREDVRFLAELGVPFALALETARQHRAILERERMRKELQLATDIQRALCPKDLNRVRELELAVLWKPCLEVGGDCYDLIPGKDGSWWLAVQALHAAVAAFVSGAALRDDVTVLCARCRA